MKENEIKKKEIKKPKTKIDIMKFVNSIDYINKDISKINNLNLYQLNNEILDMDIDLEPYINELNKRLNNEHLIIKNEIQLYE